MGGRGKDSGIDWDEEMGIERTSKSAGKTYSPIDPHPTLPKGVQDSFNGGTFTQKLRSSNDKSRK